MTKAFDVVVVGSGNAGLSAALAARQYGATVCVVEKAPADWAGGNSYFTAGAFRVTYDSVADLQGLVGLDDGDALLIDLAPYRRDAFLADMQRVTHGRTDPALATILAEEATDAVRWLGAHGIEWELLVGRQSFRVDGRIRFWGNLVLGTKDGGRGLVERELQAIGRAGIECRYEWAVVDLQRRDGRVTGVVCDTPDGVQVVDATAVILAAGGFEADAARRASHLGPGWDLAKVRGTPFNTGEVLFRAIELGAEATGHWSGCHAIAWDAAAPAHGDRDVTNRFSRQAYPFAVVVNREGRRFLDEGADFRNYTYAKYGAEILRQPGALAYQVFDARSVEYTSATDYATATSSRTDARSLADLGRQMDVDVDAFTRTINEFNAAVTDEQFDPSVRDGKRTVGVSPPKSNWALPVETPPFVAFAVTCGITFTFGGLRIDGDARVLRPSGRPIEGLFACGELVGGLFYHNYPGGTGLTAGTVFGRRAGRAAAERARTASSSIPAAESVRT